jgi:hypothetical protein
MPKCNEILTQIETRSGLDRNNGYPLYRYRVTTDELELLRRELIHIFTHRGTLRMPDEYAAFCLFGAEWFRRHYQSGPWSWEVIFDGLALAEANRPGTQTLYVYVERGLRYWRIRLLSNDLMRLFLQTLICQGGFPINTLRHDGTGLRGALKATLRDHEREPFESIDNLLSRHIHNVSPTLQRVEVRRLFADLVQAIARLRKTSDEATNLGIPRAVFLDERFKGWEAELPLRVEEPEAKDLLLSLLDTAKPEPVSRHAISIATSLSCDSGKPLIIRTLRCPSKLSEEDLIRACKVSSPEGILPRMTGYLQAGGQRVPAISISRSNDGSGFRLQKHPSVVLSGSQAYFETSLVLAVGGEEIHRASLPGGEALPESPWVFTSDDTHQLIGVGSIQTREESVWVALPEKYKAHQQDATEFINLGISIADRNVFQLTGEACIAVDDVTYRLKTKSETSRKFLFELRGKSKRLGIGGTEVWCGPPKVFQLPLDEDEIPFEIPRELVQWKPVSGGTWNEDFSRCLGQVKIRVQKDGYTQYLAKAIVTPPNLELEVVPGREQGTGTLHISGLGRCKIDIKKDERIEASATREDGGLALKVKVVGDRPGLIEARVTFDNGNYCDVFMVCPTTSISILNVLGNHTDFPAGIPADKLDGLTVQVIQPDQRRLLLYWPEGHLLIDRMRETNVPGVFEYPLSYLTSYAGELLACSADPDGTVHFGIGYSVAYSPKFRFSVSRYSHGLEKVPAITLGQSEQVSTEICVKGLAGTEITSANDCTLVVVPMESPNDQMPADTILVTERNTWRIDHSAYTPGFYLAIAKDSSGNSYRPLRFLVKRSGPDAVSQENQNDRPSFLTTINIPDKNKRLRAWDTYFQDIATDLFHPDWPRIDEFVKLSETLPVTTFEAVAAITRNHFAAARYGIIYPTNETLWRRFEQLPFLWSAIPIAAWLTTASRCSNFVRKRLNESDIEIDEVENLLSRARNQFVKEAPNRSLHMGAVVTAMFASEHFGIELTEDLARLHRRFTLATRTREHTRLISHHDRFDTRSTWPNFRILCNQDERDLLRSSGLVYDDIFPNQWPVLNGPGIAAVKAVHGAGLTAEEIPDYKRLRAVDPDWYDIANAVAMFVLLDRRFKAEPNYLRDLLGTLNK